LQSKGYTVSAALPVDRIDSSQTIRDASIELMECSLSRTGIGPISNLIYFFQLIKIIKTNQFDFVFLTTFKPIVFGNLALMVAHKKSTRAISMITGLGYVFTYSSMK
ncbi:glycosyltransferase family 4 protein, partial [bacterium]|nr:glycosyltransferase family 4 protein [bacterium]